MKKNMLFRKGLVCAILVLFVCTSIVPIAGSLSTQKQVSTKEQILNSDFRDDDTTPPVTTPYFHPATPDGDNCWFVSDVTITLKATDDLSGVNVTYYRINSGEWEIYTKPIVIQNDGYCLVEFYSFDNAGNVENVKSFVIKVDQTPPDIKKFVYESNLKHHIWYVTFKVNFSDDTSGKGRAEFYVNNGLVSTDYDEPYEWTFEWSDIFLYLKLKVVVFDMAGNSNFSTDLKPDPFSYQFDSGIIGNPSQSQPSSIQQGMNPLFIRTLQSGGKGMSVVINDGYNIKNIIFPESDVSRVSIYKKTTQDFVSSPLDELCYPVLNGTLGDNGWYISNVTVSFIYDPEKVATVYYILDGAESTMYTEPFEVCDDKEHYICWYYIDYYGNYSGAECKNVNIDQTPPELYTTWYVFKEKEGWDTYWYVKFTALCNDNTSGIDRVEFSVTFAKPEYIDYDFPYEWTIEWDPNILQHEWFFSFIAFDKAGNSAFDTVNFDDIKPRINSISSSQNSHGNQQINQILQNLILHYKIRICN